MNVDRVTRLDAVAEELVERDRLLRRAQLVARGRRDSAAGCRATIRDLVTVLALAPFTRATDAPPGRLGQPIEPNPAHLQESIPRQRRAEAGRCR